MKIPINQIKLEHTTQSRQDIDLVAIVEYTERMQAGDIFPPITVFADNDEFIVVDGFHRIKAAEKANLQTIDATIKNGTLSDAQWFSYGVNKDHGLRRSNADKRRAVENALMHEKGAIKSDREIARHVGVDHKTVGRIRNEIQASGEIPQIERREVTRNGKTYTQDTSNIGNVFEKQYQVAVLEEVAKIETPGKDLSPLMSSASNEWYTTDNIINAVIAVMGSIDLDPCSNSHDDPNVPAGAHFTKDDDGLSQKWHGRVYVNPPYGSAIPHWIDKILLEYDTGRINQCILLVPSRTDTRWFRKLKPYARCFMHGRVKFNGHNNSAPFPTMLVNIGCDAKRFYDVMSDLGDIYESVQF